MSVPYWLLLPAAAAVIYTVASLFFKRGYGEGAGTMQTFHWANLIAMPFCAPLFLANPGHLPLTELWRPALTAACIYAGSLGTFAAIRRGDVSMVTPVLGTKVIFVALGVVTISGGGLSTGLWIAALLATAGIFFIGSPDLRSGRTGGPAILLCLVSALFFALTDVLIGQWAKQYGGTTFLAVIPQFLGVFSLLTVACSRTPVLRLAPLCRPRVIIGGMLLSAQLLMMGTALTFFSDPTGVNILYSTRGLWSIVLVWMFGSWFGNRESQTAGRRTMLWRLAGTVLITAGVVIAIFERSR